MRKNRRLMNARKARQSWETLEARESMRGRAGCASGHARAQVQARRWRMQGRTGACAARYSAQNRLALGIVSGDPSCALFFGDASGVSAWGSVRSRQREQTAARPAEMSVVHNVTHTFA